MGDVEPGGRLPTSWPRTEIGLPTGLPRDGTLAYSEGLHVGYRGVIHEPERIQYPFGHGLGYSRWTYESLRAPAQVPPGEPVEVEVVVRNSGPRHSRELVQVYASRPASEIERPARWLAAFAHAEADAGRRAIVKLTVCARTFEHWDVAGRAWATEPGRFDLAAGASSQQLPLAATVCVAPIPKPESDHGEPQ